MIGCLQSNGDNKIDSLFMLYGIGMLMLSCVLITILWRYSLYSLYTTIFIILHTITWGSYLFQWYHITTRSNDGFTNEYSNIKIQILSVALLVTANGIYDLWYLISLKFIVMIDVERIWIIYGLRVALILSIITGFIHGSALIIYVVTYRNHIYNNIIHTKNYFCSLTHNNEPGWINNHEHQRLDDMGSIP
jgi:hypothetical protein